MRTWQPIVNQQRSWFAEPNCVPRFCEQISPRARGWGVVRHMQWSVSICLKQSGNWTYQTLDIAHTIFWSLSMILTMNSKYFPNQQLLLREGVTAFWYISYINLVMQIMRCRAPAHLSVPRPKVTSTACSRPLSPMRLWDVEATFFLDSRRWRWGWNPYALAAPLPPRRFLVLISDTDRIEPMTMVWLRSIIKSNDPISSGTCEVPACSIVLLETGLSANSLAFRSSYAPLSVSDRRL
jgi:hypothetical protein